jgi:hypothetical protein
MNRRIVMPWFITMLCTLCLLLAGPALGGAGGLPVRVTDLENRADETDIEQAEQDVDIFSLSDDVSDHEDRISDLENSSSGEGPPSFVVRDANGIVISRVVSFTVEGTEYVSVRAVEGDPNGVNLTIMQKSKQGYHLSTSNSDFGRPQDLFFESSDCSGQAYFETYAVLIWDRFFGPYVTSNPPDGDLGNQSLWLPDHSFSVSLSANSRLRGSLAQPECVSVSQGIQGFTAAHIEDLIFTPPYSVVRE